jgi:hypothetical protein
VRKNRDRFQHMLRSGCALCVIFLVYKLVRSRYSDKQRAGRPGFDSRQCKIFLLHSVQTDSGAHPASYPMGPGGTFPGSKAAGVKLTTHFHLVPRSRNGGAIPPLPIYVHDIVLD